MRTLQEISQSVANIAQDIWKHDSVDNSYATVSNALHFVQSQLRLRKELQVAVDYLEQPAWTAIQAGRYHKRVVSFIEPVFSRQFPPEKHLALRQLSAHTLALCAFTWRLDQIPQSAFDFFITNLEDFIRCRNLLPHLYRHNIVEAISKLKISGDSFKSFQRYLNFVPTVLPARDAGPPSVPEAHVGNTGNSIASSRALQDKANVDQDSRSTTTLELRKHPRDENSAPSDEPLRKHTKLEKEPEFFASTYEPFSTVARPNMSKLVERQNNYGLSELIHEGIKTGIKWKQEVEKGGLDITQCVSLYLPDSREDKDAFIVFRVSKRSGWRFLDLLDFGQIP